MKKLLSYRVARWCLKSTLYATGAVILVGFYENSIWIWGTLGLIPLLFLSVSYAVVTSIINEKKQHHNLELIIINFIVLISATAIIYMIYRDFQVNGFGML